MNRQEAEKIKDELASAFRQGSAFEISSNALNFESWFEKTYPPEPEYIPFEWNDWKLFMGEMVKRKGVEFNNDTFFVSGLNLTSVLVGLEWKTFGYMLDEWEFSDGRPFGKLKK